MSNAELSGGMTGALEEYLDQFRSGDQSLLEPVNRTQQNARPRRGRARLYYGLRDALPPGLFESLLDAYYGARGLVGREPGHGRILPDFMVIGAAKCGTTSLFDWICQHPYVVRPTTDGRERKELLYFDYGFAKRPGWYREHFALQSERDAFTAQHGRPFLTGEATATYLTHWWAPKRAAGMVPDAKLIVTLRNPVDRAYSAFHMSRRRKVERSEVFEEAIALEAQRLAPEEAATRSDPHYNPPLPPPLGYWSYLTRSRYDEHISRWFEFFPRDQFLFIEFEQMAADPQATLDRVYDFLGLPPHQHEAFPQLNTGSYTSMSAETRAALVEYFRPHNARVRELTGMNFGWDR